MNNTTKLITWALDQGLNVHHFQDLLILDGPGMTVNLDTDGNVAYENVIDPFEPVQEMFDSVEDFLQYVQ